MAQTGPLDVEVTSSALTGSVTCSDGTVNSISLDPSTAHDSGSNDSAVGSSSLTLCGQNIYQSGAIDDSTSASDTTSLDDGVGTTKANNVSMLGGLVTYTKEDASSTCEVTDPVARVFSCSGSATVSNLDINGVPAIAAGTYAPGTTLNIVNAHVLSPACTGVALFTGKLVLEDEQIYNNNSLNPSAEMAWLHLIGDAVCVGLPLGTTHYDLRDDNFTSFMNTFRNGYWKGSWSNDFKEYFKGVFD